MGPGLALNAPASKFDKCAVDDSLACAGVESLSLLDLDLDDFDDDVLDFLASSPRLTKLRPTPHPCTLRMARSAMDPCPGLTLPPEVGGRAKNPPDFEGGGVSIPPAPVFVLVETDAGVPMRVDTALGDVPRMRTEFTLFELALTCAWGCESKSPESSELKCTRVRLCLCGCC